METIPEIGFVRLKQVLAVIPLGKTCWWEGVKSGRFPKPVKLSERCTAWRAEDIHVLIRQMGQPAHSSIDGGKQFAFSEKQFVDEIRKMLDHSKQAGDLKLPPH